MSFNLHETDFYKSNFGNKSTQKDYAAEAKELLMCNHGLPRNTEHWKQFDFSHYTKDDIVLIVDGDWLAFSACSKEMVRYVDFEHNGKVHRFEDCYTGIKKYCKQNNIEYEIDCGVKGHYMKPKSIIFAKSTIKKKIRYAIEKTGATRVVVFCGSDGNHRDNLPLPSEGKLSGKYKGQRGSEWIPSDLKEIKDWIMISWESHWAVGEESDDCITITKHGLDSEGIKCFIRGIDKDFCGEQVGGLFLIGHQDVPEYFEDIEENRLGWVQAIKTEGGSDKMLGHGDKFLCYQIISADDADNYSAKSMMKEYGSLKNFGYKGIEKFLSGFKSRKELWQGVVDHFYKYLPREFEYIDCFGVKRLATPMSMLNLYYKCAKMREFDIHVPDVFADRLELLEVKYD